MKVADINAKAREMGIDPRKMKKKELIRAIQQAENNIVCYATERVAHCEEYSCLWRRDCVNSNGRR